MRLSFVVAMDRRRLIGAGGGLPWRLPADLRFFRQTTLGHAVLMGRRTWESLPRAPLPGRRNVVLTRRAGYRAVGAAVVPSSASARRLLAGSAEVMVIGGAQIYEALLPEADRLYVTEVDGEFEGDTWLPELDLSAWRETASRRHPADERNPHALRFVTLDRRRQPAAR